MNEALTPTDIVTTENGKLFLNSGLNEIMFAKTKFSLLLNEYGTKVKKDENGEWNNFSLWKFDEIKTEETKVSFCGSFNGSPLSKLFYKDEVKKNEYLYAVCECYVNAIKQNKELPCNGPEAIIINTENQEILFLPEKTFDSSCANFGKTLYNYFQNDWRDFLAKKNDAMSFSLGCFSYFALSKKLPYSQENDRKISDRNFIPLEYEINGINKELALSINNLLLGKLLEKTFPLESLKKELFENESNNHKIPQEDFIKLSESYIKKQKTHLKQKRFVQKNTPLAIALCGTLIFFALAISSIIKENGKKPVTIGLDSLQTVQVFYKGLHTMDTDLMLCAAKDCPQAQGYISKVPQIYLTGQMKSAYNFDSGISTPENWFFFEPDTTKSYSHYIYGITNFYIDEKPYILDIKVPTKKNHPSRKIFAEDGSKTKIEKSPDSIHNVKYFLVHNQDNLIQVEQFNTTVTLRFSEKAWTILKLEQKSSSRYFLPLQVSLDYKNALKEYKNEIDALDSLREKYDWLPSKASLIAEKERLDKIGY